jgi:phosphocarrier protein HPr
VFEEPATMPERHAVVGSKVGLHARPAAMLVQAASRQPLAVTIAKPGGKPANAKSILSVLALSARSGDEVVFRAEGDGAEAALEELAALVERDLDSVEAEG